MKKIQTYIKQNYKYIIFVFLYGIFTYCIYFKSHYVHDSYRIFANGFLQNLEGFFTQGRPISMWFNILFNFLNISPGIGQKISIFLTIAFLSISILVVHNLILKRIKPPQNKLLKITILLIITGMFFNVYITEWMVFLESCVIALGCLTSIIAAYFTVEKNGISKYIYSSIFLVISVFCYQSSIVIGGAIIVLLTIFDNKEKNLFKIAKLLIINMLPYVFALICNFLFIKIININNVSDPRLSGNVNILYNLYYCIKNIKSTIIYMFNYPTKTIVAILMLSVIIYYFYTNRKNLNGENKKSILFIFISIFSLYLLSILPILVMSSDNIYFTARNIPYIASLFPFLLLCIVLFNNNHFINKRAVYSIVVIVYTLIVTFSIFKITYECIKNNKVDIQTANIIQSEIDKYEKETNIVVTDIILLPDSNITKNNVNIKLYSDNSIRAFSSDYGTKEIMKFVTSRDYNVSLGDNKQKVELFGNNEWNGFDISQLKFSDNILYLVNY